MASGGPTTAHDLLDAIVSFTAITDVHGRVVRVNAEGAASGYSSVELVGMPVWEAYVWRHDASASDQVRDAVARAVRGDVVRETITVGLDTGKETIGLLATPVDDEETGVRSVVVSAMNTSNRRRLEEEFRALIENAAEAMILVDADGAMRMVNSRVVDLFGYQPQELIGNRVEMLLPEDLRAHHPAMRAGYVAAPSIRPMGAGRDLRARRKDGTEFPVQISLATIETDEGLRIWASIVDLTEVVRAQKDREALDKRLQRSERLESLGQLAGGIAHDFNNLLAVILSYAEFVADAIERHSEEASWDDLIQVQTDMKEIIRAAQRAGALTRQLLIFGRREVVHPEIVDVDAVVRDVEELLRRTIGEHVELRTTTDPALWRVRADPGRLEQILVNLSVNARDAMPSGGRLFIETANVELDEVYLAEHDVDTRPGPFICLSVADTGIGMSPEVIAHAFEPFYTTKPTGEGTGLGLSTVYGIVRQHGGHVQLYSERGRGTVVKVYLPAESSARKADVTPAEDPPPTAAATILVVEDEPAVRLLAKRILEGSGHRVLIAENAGVAKALSTEFVDHIDLLLTDVVMPGESGSILAKALSESRPGIRVLFMSGYPKDILMDHGGISHSMSKGIQLVPKPFTAKQLRDAVTAVLEGRPERAR